MLMAARGTSRVRAMDLLETKTPDPKGHITGRGTGRIRL
jgi:hypothetical protein